MRSRLVQTKRQRDTSFHGAATNERIYRRHMSDKAMSNPFAPGGYVYVVPGFNDRRFVLGPEWTVARILDVCARRRNLSFIYKQRGFLRRWLQRFEPGILFYLKAVETKNDWHDLRSRKHTASTKSYSTVPTQTPALNAQFLLASISAEVSAVGRFWSDISVPVPEPLPAPGPDADKDGSGGEGSSGAAGSTAGPAKPRPEDDTDEDGNVVIYMTDEELADILSLPTPGMGGML